MKPDDDQRAHADHEQIAEPRLQPAPTGAERKFNGVIARAATAITSFVAVLLLGLVVIALVGVVVVSWKPLVEEHNLLRAAVAGLDAVFVAIILLELVHTTLSRGPISSQIQEFLVIGVTSAIRCGLASAANGDRDPRETAIVLAITSGSALLLVAALWLLRKRLHDERKAHSPDSSSRNDELSHAR